MTEQEGSEFLEHIPCPACGSSDANSLYSDGHTHCFSCGAHTQGEAQPQPKEKRVSNGSFIHGDYTTLPARKISEETCRKFSYAVGTDEQGEPCHIATYRLDGQIVGQKIRYKDKSFAVRGKVSTLFGQHLWSKGKMLVVTEGEIDALSVSQVQNNKWPVVSIPNGAQSARKALARANETGWLDGFETIVLMFDMDAEGAAAADACAQLFEPGRVKVAALPLKDANEMLVAGRGTELVDAIWQAKPYRPDGIVRVADLRDRLLRPIEWGLPWPWETLTTATYGRRPGEVYTFGAGSGVGKTDLFTQTIAYTVREQGLPCALFYLEQPADETVRRVAGKLHRTRFHVPDAGWTREQWVAAVDELEAEDKLYLYDHFGSADWDIVKSRVRYLARAEGVRHFFIDHLTAFAAHAEDERRELEALMAEVSMLAQELQVTLYLISHLATPEGTPHEEGGRVMARHFKGSRAITFWSHFMFGLERNTQADDPTEKITSTLRVLKDRYTGQSTGLKMLLRYDHKTGILNEVADTMTASAAAWEDTPF